MVTDGKTSGAEDSAAYEAATVEPGRHDAVGELKQLAVLQDPRFFPALRACTVAARGCEEVLLLSSLRKRAARKGLALEQQTIRVALVGGYTLHPLNELVAHFLSVSQPASLKAELLLGDFDNYMSEFVEDSSRVYEFKPDVIVFLPSHRRCQYSGHLFDPRERQESEARGTAAHILDLCRTAHQRPGAGIV